MLVCVRSATENLAPVMKIKGIPILQKGRDAEKFAEGFQHCAMSVAFDYQESAFHRKVNHKTCYIIASDDLQLLCESLFIHYCHPNLYFHLYKFLITIHRDFAGPQFHNKIPSLAQRRLLEPFTVLHSVPNFYSVPNFQIVCPAHRAYCDSIIARVSRRAPTASEYIDRIGELTNVGHVKVAVDNDPKGAIEAYKMAFSELMYAPGVGAYSCSRKQRGLLSSLYIELLMDIANSYRSLREYEEALSWAWEFGLE